MYGPFGLFIDGSWSGALTGVPSEMPVAALGDGTFLLRGVKPAADLDEGRWLRDVLSLHVPKVVDEPLIGRSELAPMRPPAILVNAAHGGLIDEAALAEKLSAERPGGAVLSMFAPNNAGLTVACARRMAVSAAANIMDFFDGRIDPSLAVNQEQVESRAGEEVGV